MLTVLLINVEASGHTNPTLPVAAALVRAGARVVYFAPEEFRARIEATGATFEPYATTRPFDTAARDDFPGWLAHMMSEARHVLSQVVARARELKPNVVAYDTFAISGSVLRDILRVPAVKFHATFAENERFSLVKMFNAPMDDNPAVAAAEEEGRAIGSTYQVPAPSIRDLFGGKVEAHNIVFIPRFFQREAETFDDRFAFVGPSIPTSPPAAEWKKPEGNGPLLYVSLGTTSREPWPQFFRMCIDAFRGTSWRVLMSTADRAQPSDLGELPPNIVAVRSAPQHDVLRSASLFVAHGGMNSAMEALYFGVPTVVIPQMPEQEANARRIEELGFGKRLARADVTHDTLRREVEAVHADTAMRARIDAAHTSIVEAGGSARAAEEILAIAAKHQATTR